MQLHVIQPITTAKYNYKNISYVQLQLCSNQNS